MTSLVLAQAAGAEGDPYLMWGFILAGAALGLLLLELLVPSGGLLGIVCGIAAIGSIVAFFRHDTAFGVAALLAYAILTPILLVFIFKLWIHSPLAKRMVLGGDDGMSAENGQESVRAAETARLQRLEELRRLIGTEGVSVTPLRPVGFVKIEGRRVDAMAESGIVEANTPVIVTDVYDNQIKVRPKG